MHTSIVLLLGAFISGNWGAGYFVTLLWTDRFAESQWLRLRGEG